MPDRSIPPPQHVVEIDETYLAEWIEFGMTELATYLYRKTQFDHYLTTHNRKD
jgi:hypothetical protein